MDMKLFQHLIAISCLLIAAGVQAQQPGPHSVTKPELRLELLKRVEQDQAIRNELIKKDIAHPDPALLKQMNRIDAVNTARVKAIIKQYGWPGPDLVGDDGSNAAFLLIQHADRRSRKELRPLAEKAFQTGALTGQNYALFIDRVLVEEGKLQIYGTSAKPFDQWNGTEPTFEPIEDEANLDKRRAQLGLMPHSEYREFMKKLYFPEKPKN